MNVDDPALKKTTVISEALRRPTSFRFNPVRPFVDMNFASKFWFAAFVLTLVLSQAERLLPRHNDPERVIVVDGNTIFCASTLPFHQPSELHFLHAKLATQAFLNRNPSDFDSPDLLRILFLTDAFAKAKNHLNSEAEERAAKHLHQKVEVAAINILETRDDRVLIEVTGQLIRNGVFQNRPLDEGVSFSLSLTMFRNPDMMRNSRFPLAVGDFKYETNR